MRASKKVKGAVLLTAGAALFLGAPTVYAASGGDGGDGGDAGSKGNNTTSGSGSLLGGLQLLNNADVNVPATVCGVGAILALGSGNCEATAGSNSGGSGGNGGGAVSTAKSGKSTTAKGGDGGSGGNGGSKGNNTTSGRGSILGGLQVGNNLDANVPVTACGVGALLARGNGNCDVSAGTGNGGSGGDGGKAVAAGKHGKGSATGGDGGDGGDAGSKGNNTTSGAGSILGGAQVLNNADLNIPITLCGVALLAASAGCTADVSAGTGNGGAGGDGGGAFAGGRGRGGGVAIGGEGGDGGSGGSMGNNTTSGAGSILGGLQLLNNASVNVPVTVCGLALLGRAGCVAEVTAGSGNGGKGGKGGTAIGVGNDDSGVGSAHRDWEATAVRHATRLPHTGAAGMALIPFGMALVAGGFALRRRNSGVEA
jgi:hypothetical protein